MKNRILKEGKYTTILGLLIIIASVTAWLMDKVSVTEVMTICTFASGLFVVKDRHIGLS